MLECFLMGLPCACRRHVEFSHVSSDHARGKLLRASEAYVGMMLERDPQNTLVSFQVRRCPDSKYFQESSGLYVSGDAVHKVLAFSKCRHREARPKSTREPQNAHRPLE